MPRLPVGSRSLLYGAHQFILHPVFVALAWRKLHGRWPRELPIWVAFVVHDWGYWGLAELDGEAGIYHPWRGAVIVSRLFDHWRWLLVIGPWFRWPWLDPLRRRVLRGRPPHRWFDFAAGHSRTYAERIRIPTSDLMAADKLATVLYPRWLYALLCWLSGEYIEYRDRWVAAGTYPGTPTDNAWTYCGHLQANWSRFRRPGAVAGRAYGGE